MDDLRLTKSVWDNNQTNQPLTANMSSDGSTNDSLKLTKSVWGDQPSSNIDSSTAPDDVLKSQQDLGKQDYNGMCEAYAEKVTGQPNMGGSAAEAWNNYVKQGSAFSDINSAPAGSLIYFAPDQSNEDYGHVAIADGKGNITGATDTGVASHSITDWMKMTGQQPLGFVIPHLLGGSN